jgi:hypothetical protein
MAHAREPRRQLGGFPSNTRLFLTTLHPLPQTVPYFIIAERSVAHGGFLLVSAAQAMRARDRGGNGAAGPVSMICNGPGSLRSNTTVLKHVFIGAAEGDWAPPI